MSTKIAESKRSLLASILSGVIVAVAVTLVLILVFALLIRFFNINDNFIFPVNQIIKVLSLFVGTITAIKKSGQKGFILGILLGIFYYIFSYLVFSLLQGAFTFDIKNIYDFILTTLMGGLIGIIVINFIKK